MFSVVIKNSILMLLLILIIHFMIINYLSDLQNTYGSKSVDLINDVSVITKSLKDENSLEYRHSVTTIEKQNAEHDTSTKLNDESDLCISDSEKELYDFVYNDKKAESQLNTLYDITKPCDLNSDELIECTQDEHKGETISFCKNNVDMHFENNELERLQPSGDEMTKDGNPIMFKYNESKDNLYDGFENFGSSYMLLKN